MKDTITFESTVTVVIPSFNDEGTIDGTLRSVTSQTVLPFEVLLCDDGSTDGTVRIATEVMALTPQIPFSVVPVKGKGAAAARNAGIAVAKGAIVAFLDSDDLWYSTKIEVCLKPLRSGADAVVHSEVWRNALNGRTKTVHYSEVVQRHVALPLSVYRRNPFSTSATMVRTARIREAGFFDESLPSAEDYDYWMKLTLLEGFQLAFINQPLGEYVVRPGSESAKVDRRHAAMLSIGERYLSLVRYLSEYPDMEGRRYRSRTFLASGVRFFQSGRTFKGAWFVLRGLSLWPVQMELGRFVRNRPF